MVFHNYVNVESASRLKLDPNIVKVNSIQYLHNYWFLIVRNSAARRMAALRLSFLNLSQLKIVGYPPPAHQISRKTTTVIGTFIFPLFVLVTNLRGETRNFEKFSHEENKSRYMRLYLLSK